MVDYISHYGIEGRSAKFSTLTAGVAVAAVFLLLPLYVGVLAHSLCFSKGELGLLASMDLFGLAFMSITAPLWISHINWRDAVRGALIWFIVCNFLSMYVVDFWLFGIVRLLSSVSFGLVTVIVITISSYTKKPDRFIALLVVYQVTFQVLGFQIVPDIVKIYGISGFLFFLNAVLFIAFLVSAHVPISVPPSRRVRGQQGKNKFSVRPILILISYSFFFIAQVSIFSFVEQLGVESGFSIKEVGSSLSIAATVGLLGALAGAVISDRLGRFPPLIISGLCQIGAFYLLARPLSYTYFLLAVIAVQVFWNLPLGHQMGVLIKEDFCHQWIVFAPFAQAIGIAFAPALGGFMVEAKGYEGLIGLVSIAMIIYIFLISPFAYVQDYCKPRNREKETPWLEKV